MVGVCRCFLFQAEDGIRDYDVTGVQTCALPISMQMAASGALGFTASRTMRAAQGLYEGVNAPGEGQVGLITYMRTDSVTLAQDALADIRQLIQSHFGSKDLPGQPRLFKTKSKNAQEAHEAIRPTSASRIPDSLKRHE